MVGAIGYGAMVLEGYYGSSDDTNAALVLNRSDSGVTMIDTADAYGNGHNEKQLQALKSRRQERFLLPVNLGITFEEEYSGTNLPTGWGFGLNIKWFTT